MIGEREIIVDKLPKRGDREDFSIRIVGPGDTEHNFPLSITGTVLAIWQEKDENDVAKQLSERIINLLGTASPPPKNGFWFDSYNSKENLADTLNEINSSIDSFLKEKSIDEYVNKFGAPIVPKVLNLNNIFSAKFSQELFRSLDDAFEYSQALEDLSTEAKDGPHFLYRVCILSVIIDHFNVSLPNTQKKGSLNAFKEWLESEVGKDKANRFTECFYMVKKLRKQYPIHEQFDIGTDGTINIRSEITQAKSYFNLRGDFAWDWDAVVKKFTESLDLLIKEFE